MVNILVMKNIKAWFKINPATYFLILTFLFTGLIKNIIFIYLIVIIHECGHIFIIKLLGYKIKKVEIYPMGGVTTIDKKINSSLRDELLISIFGLLFQFVLGLFAFFIYQSGVISTRTYELFYSYNRTIFLFNMLPIIPLDGYHFLRSIWECIFPFKLSFYISFIISLVGIGLFISYNEIYSLNNYLIISFLVYKIITTYKDFKFSYFRFLMERYLYPIKYKKIKYENKENLAKLKKETYHYFKEKDSFISEKKVLAKKFDKSL